MLACTMLVGQAATSQTIYNGDFELGALPTQSGQITSTLPTTGNGAYTPGWDQGCTSWYPNVPLETGTSDLLDTRVGEPNTFLNIPYNYINVRVAGTKRYVGMLGSPVDANGNRIGESLRANITGSFSTQYRYTIGMWVALRKEQFEGPITVKMEVVLRKAGNCTAGKLVYTSVDVNADGISWKHLQGDFTLTAADISVGYDRMEIRINGETGWNKLCLDDVTLTRALLPVAAYNFTVGDQTQTTTPSKYGAIPVTESCRTPVTIDGSATTNEAGYYISVTKFDAVNWLDIGPSLYAGWICNPASACQVPATINLSALPGVSFVAGQLYIIRLAVGPEWNSVDHFFRPTACTSKAAFVFNNPRQTVKDLPSYYGPIQVTSICKPDVIIDGSASTSETEYQLTITKFDLTNWVPIGSQLFNQTYFNTTVPASINLENLTGVNFTANNTDVYQVSVITKPVWNIATRYMKVIDCGTSKMLEDTELQPEEVDFRIFPNPATNQLNIVTNGNESLQSAAIYDLKGMLVKSANFSGASATETLDISTLTKGIYLVKSVTANGTVHQTKIVKE